MNKYEDDLNEIQQQYFELLNSFNVLSCQNDFYISAVSLIEMCVSFWQSKKLQMSLILDDLTKENRCFILSGAIYLNTADDEHYIFGTLGDIHILNDPFVRMRGFFVNGADSINEHTISYFYDVYSDTLNILNKFSNQFKFLPIDLMFDSIEKDKLKVIDKGYWNVISSLLKTDINSIEEMKRLFSNIDEIEKQISKEALNSLIFYDIQDVDLSLVERLNKYFNDSQMPINIDIDDTIERFHFATFAQISQVLEIILKCLQFNIIPFVRFEVTFRYLMLIGVAFSNDSVLKQMLSYSIIAYLFSKNIDRDEIIKMDFNMLSDKCKSHHFIDTVYNKLNQNGKDIFSFHIEEVVNELIKTFDDSLLA
jgi:hypothetical protein